MLDTIFRASADTIMDKWATRVMQGGLSADKLTLFSLLLGLVAAFAASMQIYPLALLLILLHRFLSALGGAVARQAGITPLGSYLDIVSEFIVCGSFVFLFTLGALGTSLAAAFLLLSYLVMAAAWLAQSVFMAREDRLAVPRGGLVEKSEMTVFMVVCCAYPPAFAAFAALFGLLCFTTAAMRIGSAVRVLKG